MEVLLIIWTLSSHDQFVTTRILAPPLPNPSFGQVNAKAWEEGTVLRFLRLLKKMYVHSAVRVVRTWFDVRLIPLTLQMFVNAMCVALNP